MSSIIVSIVLLSFSMGYSMKVLCNDRQHTTTIRNFCRVVSYNHDIRIQYYLNSFPINFWSISDFSSYGAGISQLIVLASYKNDVMQIRGYNSLIFEHLFNSIVYFRIFSRVEETLVSCYVLHLLSLNAILLIGHNSTICG